MKYFLMRMLCIFLLLTALVMAGGAADHRAGQLLIRLLLAALIAAAGLAFGAAAELFDPSPDDEDFAVDCKAERNEKDHGKDHV